MHGEITEFWNKQKSKDKTQKANSSLNSPFNILDIICFIKLSSIANYSAIELPEHLMCGAFAP